MGTKRHKPGEIVAKLRSVEILTGQGKSIAEAARSIGVAEQTYFRWRAEYGGMKNDRVKRLKELEMETPVFCARKARPFTSSMHYSAATL
jgi:putative transposase